MLGTGTSVSILPDLRYGCAIMAFAIMAVLSWLQYKTLILVLVQVVDL